MLIKHQEQIPRHQPLMSMAKRLDNSLKLQRILPTQRYHMDVRIMTWGANLDAGFQNVEAFRTTP